jgi:DNA helicase TIP49 (TBP-interacting protein)
MDNAFAPGDPVLEIAGVAPSLGTVEAHDKDITHWVARGEQEMIDQIVNGSIGGHYYLLIGEKGTGKTSMLLDAMRKVDGEGIAMFEAHADLEIFRIRFGKALDFEFHEE